MITVGLMYSKYHRLYAIVLVICSESAANLIPQPDVQLLHSEGTQHTQG